MMDMDALSMITRIDIQIVTVEPSAMDAVGIGANCDFNADVADHHVTS
jgi:hypothetical protein